MTIKWTLNLLVKFYRGATESILTGNTIWFVPSPGQEVSTVVDYKCQEHYWYHLQSINDISDVRCLYRDSPASLLSLLFDKRYGSSRCRTTRLWSSIISQAVRVLNSTPAMNSLSFWLDIYSFISL